MQRRHHAGRRADPGRAPARAGAPRARGRPRRPRRRPPPPLISRLSADDAGAGSRGPAPAFLQRWFLAARRAIIEAYDITGGGAMRERQPPTQTVTAADVPARWGDLIDRVARQEARVVVEEGGRPV